MSNNDEIINKSIAEETDSLYEEYERQIQEQSKDFSDLLDTISTTEDRKKSLWKKIHYNALVDRRNAFMMYADLVKQIEKDSTQHAILGGHVAKYLERMSKSNEQLIKLAEIVDSKVESIEGSLTSNDNLLDKIQERTKKNK